MSNREIGRLIGYILLASIPIAFVAGVVWWLLQSPEARAKWLKKYKREKERKAEEKADRDYLSKYGEINPAIVCRHCHEKGRVRSKSTHKDKHGNQVSQKSVFGSLAIGGDALSKNPRIAKVVQFHCDNCQITWDMAGG